MLHPNYYDFISLLRVLATVSFFKQLAAIALAVAVVAVVAEGGLVRCKGLLLFMLAVFEVNILALAVVAFKLIWLALRLDSEVVRDVALRRAISAAAVVLAMLVVLVVRF